MEYSKPLTDNERLQLRTKLQKYAGTSKSNKCVLWSGNRNKHGYGMLHMYYAETGRKVCVTAGKSILALRLGHWPDRLQFACHTCDNPSCCNPRHIFEGTPKANHDDMKAKGRGNTGKKRAYATRVRKYTDEQVNVAKAMLASGDSLKHVAQTMGMKYGYVRDINAGAIKKNKSIQYPILITRSFTAFEIAYGQGRITP